MNQETLNIAYFTACLVIIVFIITRMLTTYRVRRSRNRWRRLQGYYEQLQDEIFELQKKVFPERFTNDHNEDLPI